MMRAALIISGVVVVFAVSFIASRRNEPPLNAATTLPAVQTEKARLEQLRDADDVSGMRKHVWTVLAGMTQPAALSQGEGGAPLPQWMTWYPGQQTFDKLDIERRSLMESLATPRQLELAPEQEDFKGKMEVVRGAVPSLTLFNPVAHQFIRDNKYYSPTEVTKLQADIGPFPREAVIVKTVWWPLRHNTLSPLPVWDGGQGADQNRYDTWKRVVAVDPMEGPAQAGEVGVSFFTADPGDGGQARGQRDAKVVPISSLYTYTLTEADVKVKRLIESFQWIYGDNELPHVGDKMALVGLHVMTKELDDWVWATFWWHDQPEVGRFAVDRVPELAGVWRNYLMDVAFSTKNIDQTPVFNPWLEGPLPNGLKLNCIGCHQLAGQGSKQELEPLKKLERGSFKAGVMLTDYVWSIPLRGGREP